MDPNIKKLNRIFDLIKNDEKSLTQTEVEQFFTLIITIAKNNKDEIAKDFTDVSQELTRKIHEAIAIISEKHYDILSEIDKKNTKQNGEYTKKYSELKTLIDAIEQKKGIDGIDGKDADEEYIITSVLEKIKLPENVPFSLNGSDIIDEINKLPVEESSQIDWSHIKNAPEFKEGKANGGGWRNLFQLHDVNINTPTNNQVLKYNSTTGSWENGDATGGDGMAIDGAITGATEGSVLFVGAGGVLQEDNSNFFWNNTDKQLVLGIATDVDIPENTPLTIGGSLNNYWGPYFQNQSAGDTSSTDLILGANNDNSAIAGHYINIGVNGQNYVGTTSATGIVKTVSVNTAGTGYTVGDLLTLVGGSSDAEVEVLTVSAGAVTSVKITLNGTNYTVTNFATTGGTGTGCIINVLTLYDLSGLLANDTYLIGEGGNLAIGTGDSVASKSVRFFTNGFATANERMRIGTTGNVSIGSATDAASKLDVTTNGLGITQTDTSGLVLANTTAATSGVTRQISPALRMRGSAWKSDATAASQTVDFRQYASVNTGTSTVSGDFFWQSSVNGGAYSSLMGISSVGVLTLYQGNTRTLDINASSASIVGQRIYNTSNASTSAHARYEITTGGASGGDPYTAYTVNGVTVWSQGIDNSDSDTYKISESAVLGTNDRFILRTGGLASIRAGLATAKQATLGGSIKEYFASVGNVGTGEDDLFTYTTEANIFGTNGDKIQGQYSGTTAANANNKTIKLYFAGTNILSSTALALNDKNWNMDFTLIRVSATVVRYTASFTYEGNTAEVLEVGELTGLTLSGTNILKITGEATATNDIVATMGTVTALPVSV